MARKRKHEEHVNHESWAIPYGDLVTLLLAFFVVMYAVSTVNETKYRAVSDSLSAAFAGTPHTLAPIQIGDNAVAVDQAANAPLDPQGNPIGQSVSQLAVPVVANAGGLSAMDRIVGEVEANMAGLIQQDMLKVRRKDYGVEIEISTDILFPSGSATLSPSATAVLQQLANTLTTLPNAVRVEGHTDNKPINTVAFPSNWELSAARAAGVVHLFMQSGVAPSRMVVVGQGEFRPSANNATDAGRNINRRVMVVILNNNDNPTAAITAPTANDVTKPN
ncbi:MAG: flagellar motor protein MotD [Steroidobacteraceae bacterium]